jgi:segregation and condensation protein B
MTIETEQLQQETESGADDGSGSGPQAEAGAGVAEEDGVAALEALIFASGEGLSLERLEEITGLAQDVLARALQQLTQECAEPERGVELVAVAGLYQFRTKARFAEYLRVMKTERPRRLSHAALETLAVIGYRQPIVKSDIEKIRGVDATPTLKTLLDRQLIRIVGHKATVGQPALYGTTDRFLKLFGLNSLAELPTLRDLKELESDPGEAGELLGDLEGAAEEPTAEEGTRASSQIPG